MHDQTDCKWERVASADHAGLSVVPRTMLLAVGGIDERFDYWGKEDLDLAARLKRAGVRYMCDERLKSFHISHTPNHIKQCDYLRMCTLLEENNRRQLIEANVGRLWGALELPPSYLLDGTVIVEATADGADLTRRLEPLLYGSMTERLEVLVVCCDNDRNPVERVLTLHYRSLHILSLSTQEKNGLADRVLRRVRTQRVAFLPAGAPAGIPHWSECAAEKGHLVPWMPETNLPERTARQQNTDAAGWLMPGTLALRLLSDFETIDAWRLAELASRSCSNKTFTWSSGAITADYELPISAEGRSILGLGSSVLALVPYFRCKPWLAQCLDSLTHQSRPLDGIVVIADGADDPPIDILQSYPGVSLFTALENVGPYRLVQTVIEATSYDAYLFQDSDDWSSIDRLALLLAEAARTGAELIGSQELRVDCEAGLVIPVCYPLDVNRALADQPGHALLHPTSLVSRDLFMRIGGFATAFRFGADTEFLLRAVHAARIVNVPYFCYYRRHRPNSLTTDPLTGLDSPIRAKMLSELRRNAKQNKAVIAKGGTPLLPPRAVAGSALPLTHVLGPLPASKVASRSS